MALEVGSRLGHYDVTALIGEGGMGQVYQATDTKLNRQVALKILPEAFASDPDRLARFQREAQVLASLNHPGIAAIYGIEESEGTKALVLELVEGPTLADRIAQGPIPVDEALPIAKQIAEALEAAHEQGIIHRDLKPANIKVRDDGTVKVLDFGLAKAFQPDASDPNMSQSPTISLTAAATQMGMVIGTAAYMAPEQAKGKVVDKRADVWAFGAVLYEMLTGRKPFTGDDVSTTLARVIEREPDWDALPSNLSPTLATYLRRCLEKEPKQRVHDIADARLAMEGAFETAVMAPTASAQAAPLQVWQRPVPLAAAATALLLIGGLAAWAMTRPEPTSTPDLMRFTIVPPAAAPLDFLGTQKDLAISPDGSFVVYKGPNLTGPGTQVNLRPIDQLDGAPLRGGERGVGPFVSPDGAWVGFVDYASPTTLQKVSIAGGLPVALTEAPTPVRGASWGTDDQIIFGTNGGGLFRVSGGGGEPDALTTLDVEQGETSHLWPFIIPDREAVLFVVNTSTPLATGQLAVFDLATGTVTRLGLAGVSPHYVSTGHVVYTDAGGSLRAVPFDATSLAVTGNTVPLVGGVMVKSSGAADFSISDNGRLVYALGGDARGGRHSLVWVDREGGEQPIAAPPRNYVYPRISPDGTRVALDLRDEENDVWIWDLARETLRRLTTDPAQDNYALWTPDGSRVVFQSLRNGTQTGGLYWKAADGTGEAEPLVESDVALAPNAVSPDGTLLVVRAGRPLAYDLSVLSLDGDGSIESLLSTEFSEANGELSPDGRWLAYQSDSSGRWEIYVRPFPDVNSGQTLISTAGGTKPLWGPDGRELFFRSDSSVVAVPILTEPTFTAGTPQRLFDGPYTYSLPGRAYDITSDGQKFLMIKEAGATSGPIASSPIHIVLNWHKELLERVPVD